MVTVITFILESKSKALPDFTEGMAEHCQDEMLYWAYEGNREIDKTPIEDIKVKYITSV